jgi:eukaryotic-like serine/threonine-protein kinase
MDPPAPDGQEHIVFKVSVAKCEYGTLVINSVPSGAGIFDLLQNKIGETPKTISRQATGHVEYIIAMPGYENRRVGGTVEKDNTLQLEAKLERSRMAVLGAPHENSLGMKFVPVTSKPTEELPAVIDVLFCVHETRIKDYDAFCHFIARETHRIDIQLSMTEEEMANHPVAKISPHNGREFCEWLTEREREAGLLPADLEYRLPKDLEWSFAAELNNERQSADRKTPSDRNSKVRGVYPWAAHETWPPPKEPRPVGNFADASALTSQPPAKPENQTLVHLRYADGKPYNDGWAFTAPVGSYPPNSLGIYDLSGNVAEWLDEEFGGPGHLKNLWVARGGSWGDYQKETLYTSFRNAIAPDRQDGQHGFRVVIAKVVEE